MSLVTFTTDFGRDDWFVGAMEGVVAGLAPNARIVHLTHGVPRGDIQAGAFALMAGVAQIPGKCIHVAVVDPGVGGRRNAIGVRTDAGIFIGPDNGVLSYALRERSELEIRRLENEDLFLGQVSNTFHGRDLFAPVAGHLAAGVPFHEVGKKIKEMQQLEWVEAYTSPVGVHGEILYIDHFGNAITNIPNTAAEEVRCRWVELSSGYEVPVGDHYQAVPEGEPLAVAGSSGFLEIAVNGGNAAAELNLKISAGLVLK